MMKLSHDEKANKVIRIVAERLRAWANKVFGQCVCQVVSLLLLLRNGAQVTPAKTNFQQNFSGKRKIVLKLLILRGNFVEQSLIGERDWRRSHAGSNSFRDMAFRIPYLNS
jgi:hypothetical protein